MAETINKELSLSDAFLDALRFESEPVRPAGDWVKESRWVRIGSKNQRSGWTFFWLAGEIGATVFGFDGPKDGTQSSQANPGKPEVWEI